MAWVLSIVWIAIQVISNPLLEQHRAKNVWKIPLPTSVDCRLVILVKLVKKASLVVPNAPVATRVKPERALAVLAKHVRRVNLVHPMIQKRMLVHHANLATIKKNRAKLPVCRAFPERIKTVPGNNRANSVRKTHSTICPLLSFAMLEVLVNLRLLQAMLNALHARPAKREHPVHHVIKEDTGQQMTGILKRVLLAKKDNIKVNVVKPSVIRVFQVCTNPRKAAKNAFLALQVPIKICRTKKFVKLSAQVMLLLVVARLQ